MDLRQPLTLPCPGPVSMCMIAWTNPCATCLYSTHPQSSFTLVMCATSTYPRLRCIVRSSPRHGQLVILRRPTFSMCHSTQGCHIPVIALAPRLSEQHTNGASRASSAASSRRSGGIGGAERTTWRCFLQQETLDASLAMHGCYCAQASCCELRPTMCALVVVAGSIRHSTWSFRTLCRTSPPMNGCIPTISATRSASLAQ
mmetsp:Transcript_23661/g.50997  ORF Transcript_23661/g.50997 Transcript_23661/m.50997 type:complete len:201 (-) Transcript_23661:670-1272(-)